VKIAKQEDIVLSVAHPNFSFNKLYKQNGINQDPIARSVYFHDRILPILLGLGMKNYEINAKATREQVEYLVNLVKKTGGLNTFGSDNHGSTKEGNKHGIFGRQNSLFTPESAMPIRDKLFSFL
jgi:hypothetical protein